MSSKIQERFIGHLQTLYTIVVALALANTIDATIDRKSLSFNLTSLPIAISFLFLLIPFYLGACRYQDKTYIKIGKNNLPKYAPLIDFVFFFLEAICFYLMSLFINNSKKYTLLFAAFLVCDVIWLAILKIEKIHTFNEVKTWF